MGGGASKKYREAQPEKQPACGEILFSVVVDLDGSNNLATLDYRDDHESPGSAAAAFVEEYGLEPEQLGPITGAVVRKLELHQAMLAEKAEEERILAAKPKIHPPAGKPERPAWHDVAAAATWRRKNVRETMARDKGDAPAVSGGFGIRSLTGAVTQARLIDAARYGKMKELLACIVEGSLSREQLNAAGEDGASPLHLTCRTGHLLACQALVDHGANISLPKPPDGTTPLYIACSHGHLSVVRFLVSCGADPEAAPDHGQSLSPVGAACIAGQLPVVRYLAEERRVNCKNCP